ARTRSITFTSLHHHPIFLVSLFLLLTPPPPRSTLFPYTTLFRSTKLDRTFITPLDREDIHALASDLDSVIDLIDGPTPGRECLRSEEHTSELQSLTNLVCRLLLEKKKKK